MSWAIEYEDGTIVREADDKNNIITKYSDINREKGMLGIVLFMTSDIEALGSQAMPFTTIRFPSKECKFLWRSRTRQRAKDDEVKEKIMIAGWRMEVLTDVIESFLYIHFLPGPNGSFLIYKIRVSNSEGDMAYRDEETFLHESLEVLNNPKREVLDNVV